MGDFRTCHVGSCHRHRACKYFPCRNESSIEFRNHQSRQLLDKLPVRPNPSLTYGDIAPKLFFRDLRNRIVRNHPALKERMMNDITLKLRAIENGVIVKVETPYSVEEYSYRDFDKAVAALPETARDALQKLTNLRAQGGSGQRLATKQDVRDLAEEHGVEDCIEADVAAAEESFLRDRPVMKVADAETYGDEATDNEG